MTTSCEVVVAALNTVSAKQAVQAAAMDSQLVIDLILNIEAGRASREEVKTSRSTASNGSDASWKRDSTRFVAKLQRWRGESRLELEGVGVRLAKKVFWVSEGKLRSRLSFSSLSVVLV